MPSRWNERFRAILNSALDAVITIDVRGCVHDWNARATEIFGWSVEQAVGRPLDELIIPIDQRAAFHQGLDRYLKTGCGPIINRRVELTAVHRDGREIPVELSTTPIKLDDRILFCAFLRDLTAERESTRLRERELLEARLLHRAATLSVQADSFEEALRYCLATVCETMGWPIGHAYVPNETGRELVSAGVWHLTNHERDKRFVKLTENTRMLPGEGLPGRIWASGQPLWIANVENDKDIVRTRKQDRLGVKGAFGFPITFDGEMLAVLEFFSTEAVREDPQLLVLMKKIGEQLGRLVEQRSVEEERARMAAIVDSSYDAIISKNLDGTITSWNSGAQRTYGYTAEEAIGENISMLFPKDQQFEEPAIRAVILAGERLQEFEGVRRHKDGRLITVAVAVSPIIDAAKRIVGSSTIERNITHRKEQEAALTRAKEAAESASRTKSEFLANISHELRTPMNAILGMTELALDERLPPMVRDYLETAYDSARSLLILLNDILDFSRIEVGRFELDRAPFRLRQTVDQTLRTLSVRAHEKGIELLLRIAPEVPDLLEGDGLRVGQLLMNLVNNAIKFTDEGEVAVTIGVTERSDDNVALLFRISDTGIGISAADQERIFAPFEQADASVTRRFTGSGLGLAICRELVTLMQGRMWVESEPGCGSTFAAVARFRVLDRNPDDPVQPLIDQVSGIHVLVVDDDQQHGEALREMLTQWAISVTCVRTADAAVQAIVDRSEDDMFQIALIDAQARTSDGEPLVERIRQEKLAVGPVVLMTSQRGFQPPADELVAVVLEKEVSQPDLLDTLVTVIHGPQASRDEVSDRRTERPLRVLLAEDTPANQKVVRAILERRGHQVSVCDNGREAILLQREHNFDVILMDVQMPTVDGCQATRRIRTISDPQLSLVPIIAMTAHAMRGDRERCLAAGMDAYIPKPLQAGRLVRLVESLGAERPAGNRIVKLDASRPAAPPAGSDSSRSEVLFDRQAALARLDGDEGLLADMMRFFVEDSPQLLEQMGAGLAAGNAEHVMRAAHSLKGLARNFNATLVSDLAARIEESARQNEPAHLASRYENLKVAVVRLRDALSAECFDSTSPLPPGADGAG